MGEATASMWYALWKLLRSRDWGVVYQHDSVVSMTVAPFGHPLYSSCPNTWPNSCVMSRLEWSLPSAQVPGKNLRDSPGS